MMSLTFGEKIKEARKQKNLTQKQLADLIGAAHNSISDWENNKNKPDPDTIELLCGVLKITPNYLLASSEEAFSPKEKLFIKKYRFISDHSPDGAAVVDTVLDREYSIVTQLAEKNKHIEELKLRPAEILELYPRQNQFERLIEYHRSASAGDGVFILGNEASAKIAISETDWNEDADFVINVSGNSMEPDYKDGDKVLVSHKIPIQHGDVGIFIVDGKVYIKEYGDKELISRNPNAENIKISEYANIVCMGKVVGKITGEYKIIND